MTRGDYKKSLKQKMQRQFLAAAYYNFTGKDLPEGCVSGHSIPCQNILQALLKISQRLGNDDLEILKYAFDGMDTEGNTLRDELDDEYQNDE